MKKIVRTLVARLRSLPKDSRRRRQRGMTLVEIMVVLVIMALVTGVVGAAVFSALEQAMIDTAKTQISQIGDALDLYRLSNRKYPSSAEGLTALVQSKNGRKPVMDSLPQDPWGHDYVYVNPGSRNPNGYDLFSYGPDEAQGTADDIGNWAEAAQ